MGNGKKSVTDRFNTVMSGGSKDKLTREQFKERRRKTRTENNKANAFSRSLTGQRSAFGGALNNRSRARRKAMGRG